MKRLIIATDFEDNPIWGYTEEDVDEVVEELLRRFDNHRKSNDLWRLPYDESWSMAEDWIRELFRGDKRQGDE